MPRVTFPPFMHYKQFKGLFIGGCVDFGDGSQFKGRAHAHIESPHKNWICVKKEERLYINGEWGRKPNMLMLHELAHILTGHGHDDIWRGKVRELGGRINTYERKQTRRTKPQLTGSRERKLSVYPEQE